MSEQTEIKASAEASKSAVEPVVSVRCPCCFREWPENCEQAICIELHNECQVCRFTPQGCGSLSGTADELVEIVDIHEKRKAKAH